MLIFDSNGIVTGSSKQYNDCLGITSHESVHRTLVRQHRLLATQYAQQVRHIIETQSSITSYDFYRSTQNLPAEIIKFHKYPLMVRNRPIGVIFDGLTVLEAERMITEILNLPTHELEIPQIKLTDIDARLLLVLRTGYNSRQASELIKITHKAANKRLERIMAQLGVASRSELLALLRSNVALSMVYSALVERSVSVEVCP